MLLFEVSVNLTVHCIVELVISILLSTAGAHWAIKGYLTVATLWPSWCCSAALAEEKASHLFN